MNIYTALNLDLKENEVLSFIGAGGKTTTIFLLGEELKKNGKKVLITTTTKIFNPINEVYDYYFLKSIEPIFVPKSGTITIFGKEVIDGKMIGISLNKLDELIKENRFDFILIEADGANGYAIKAPAEYEPVVSGLTSKTIGMIGLDCINKTIREAVHRPEIFTNIIGKNYSDIIDEDAIIRLIISDKGLFEKAKGRLTLFLNKANDENVSIGQNIRKALLAKGFDGDIIIGDVIKRKFY